MQYLNAAEYVMFGLSESTRDDLVVAASAMMDAFCRRPTLGVTQYVERLRRSHRGGDFQLGFLPLAVGSDGASPIEAVRVRVARRRDQYPCAFAEVAELFQQPGSWIDIDPKTVSVTGDGLLHIPSGLMGVAVDEAEVTYTAGWSEIPVAVKVACTQIVRNAQAMPALNVQRQKMDSLEMAYFSGTLVDDEVQRMLRPFVAGKAA
jgi:hypothetical protein